MPDLVVQPAALRVGQHHAQGRKLGFFFQVLGHAGDGAPRAGTRNEGVQPAVGLRKNLRASRLHVRGVVGEGLELVREEPARGGVGRRGVGLGPGPREVDKVARVGDGGDGDALDGGAEVVQQVGFFDGHVVGHADVGVVAAGAGQDGEGDARAANGALVDGVAAAWGEEALLLGDLDHVEGDAVLGAAAGAVEELGLGQDDAACCFGEAADLDERGVADGALDAVDDAAAAVVARPRGFLAVLEADGPEEDAAPS